MLAKSSTCSLLKFSNCPRAFSTCPLSLLSLSLRVRSLMKSPYSVYGRRTPSPGRFVCSPTSSYTDASSSSSSVKKRNPVAVAARSVAGVFVGCFTPPENEDSKSYQHSEEFKPTSVSSNPANNRRQGSKGALYGSAHNSTREIEAGTMKFSMDEIYRATRNFSPSLKIGQGGFGTVYKGRLEDGTVVAIKRAKKSLYDKHLGVEFQSEIQTLAQVEHLNLVKFYGYLEHGDEKIIVMEYVPNGTLREHLDCIGGNVLDLSQRLDIAIGVAHAITYLHTYTDHPIIHRDIKSSNILLADNFRAKVTDFGFARLAADSESGATHVSTQIKGTAGYLDPEYLKTYQLTEKSDVYSFGVLMVELLTGRRPIEPKREIKERVTPKWAVNKFIAGETILILDPKLERSAANNLVLEKIMELSVKCMAPRRQSRPSMKRCAEILWSIRKDYKELTASDFRSNSQRSASVGRE